MAGEVKKVIDLEIGHVLFIDVVGYSKLLIEEKKERLCKRSAWARSGVRLSFRGSAS
jgi:hypothetical protein